MTQGVYHGMACKLDAYWAKYAPSSEPLYGPKFFVVQAVRMAVDEGNLGTMAGKPDLYLPCRGFVPSNASSNASCTIV